MERKKSVIETVMETTAPETLRAWRVAGAEASNKLQAERRAVRSKLEMILAEGDAQEIVKGILLDDLPPGQRQLVRSMVPASIPDEQISPLVAMVYSSVGKAVRTGDAQILERLLRLSGQSPEIKIKLGNVDDKPFELLDLSTLTDDELRRLAAREKPDDYEVVDEE